MSKSEFENPKLSHKSNKVVIPFAVLPIVIVVLGIAWESDTWE